MALEDFEKALVAEKRVTEGAEAERGDHSHKVHRSHRHHRSHRGDEEDRHRRKRRRRSRDGDREKEPSQHSDSLPKSPKRKRSRPRSRSPDSNTVIGDRDSGPSTAQLKRDAWMEAPSQSEFGVRLRKAADPIEPITSHSAQADFELKLHNHELSKHHLADRSEDDRSEGVAVDEPSQHDVDYTFGDDGSQWRMTRLKGIYRRAEDTGEDVDDVALKQYGDLRLFDDAREEESELDRRKTYGPGYVGKDKPNGELFLERTLAAGARKGGMLEVDPGDKEGLGMQLVQDSHTPRNTVTLDQTALNKLKAQMMKAKLRGAPELAELEAQYEAATAAIANGKQPNVIVLSTMDNRMLAGGRNGEVKNIDNRRGRERGLVEENEDMSLEDMVREERRTKEKAGGEGQRFAERIAKDAKFDDNLEYMDENAAKLAKRIQKSEINLRNIAISELQKTTRALDNCPLCHHEDVGQPPVAPVIALGTRTYLTLPTEPEISPGGACIVPVQHRRNLLECDDDEWEEIRNFMKALTRMYASKKLGILFYENAARPEKQQHAMLTAVAAPQNDISSAPGFFREAILQEAPEWAQHKKIIDTGLAAKSGLGRAAFRQRMTKEMPYFHVWFSLDGGVGHIVEDGAKWPKADLFAREVLGEMLQKDFEVIRARGRWVRGDRRVEGFKDLFAPFDWTKLLIEGET